MLGLALAALLAGCTRGGEVSVRVGVPEAWAGPALRAFSRDHGVTVNRVQRFRQTDVVWERGLDAILDLGASGRLAAMPDLGRDRVPSMIGADARWIGLAGFARVIVFDSRRIAEADAPARVLDLAQPARAAALVFADPGRGSSAWHAAALAEVLGEEQALAFYRSLTGAGARAVESEDAVLAALAAGERTLALTDSDLALAAQERHPTLVVVVPDQQPDGLGALLLPIALALTQRGADSEPARALLADLLSAPTTLTLTVSGSQILVLRDTNAPPGMLRAADLRLMAVSLAGVGERLAELRPRLAALR
jgi:iron(III) transport system substrate-binding protein